MNTDQAEKMAHGRGFIAALDQSGGSTPKALERYGIGADQYHTEDEMFDLIHQMRARIMTSPSFTGDKILGAILFEKTMDGEIDSMPTADYLWERKHIVPFLKVDKGLAPQADGVQLMKSIPDLDDLLTRAISRHIFGTKMRSVIKEPNATGIADNVAQQFELGLHILQHGLVPILEPEVDIHAENRDQIETLLKADILQHLEEVPRGQRVIFKLTIPQVDNFYADLIAHPRVMRVVALSGGYTRQEATERLARNHGLIASFSRALTEGLSVNQTPEEFDAMLASSIEAIYQASIT
jgi:fructose-bisphosphate aldolase class I